MEVRKSAIVSHKKLQTRQNLLESMDGSDKVNLSHSTNCLICLPAIQQNAKIWETAVGRNF